MSFLRIAQHTVLSVAVASTAAYAVAANSSEFKLTVSGITEDYLGRSEQFSTLGFNGIALHGSGEYGRLSASATLGQSQYGSIDTLTNYDISLSLGAGDWQVGVGKIDRHWSPSQFTSLILSQNAPAFHSAYLRKSEPSTTDLPVLRWLGDWDGEFFIGTTEDVGQPDNALFMGMRARIRPIENLELDLVRTAQWGGTGQPQDLDTFWRILTGRTNDGAARGANQMAGIGISYTLPKIANGARIYYQGIGEDEAGYLPSCYMHLGGIEVNMPLFGVPSQYTLEHTETRIKRTASGWCGPNTAYRNGTYSYAQNSVVLGAAIDTESVSTSLHVKHELADMSLNWSVGHYVINDQSLASHRLTTTRSEGFIGTAGLSRELLGGTVNAIIAYQDFDLDTAGYSKGTRFGLRFEKSF